MFGGLRTRLLASYSLIILLTLAVIGVALFFVLRTSPQMTQAPGPGRPAGRQLGQVGQVGRRAVATALLLLSGAMLAGAGWLGCIRLIASRVSASFSSRDRIEDSGAARLRARRNTKSARAITC